jgi:hypothetical protein
MNTSLERDWLDYVDVFGGLFVALIVFALGYAMSGYIERKKARRELESTKRFFEIYWKQQLTSAEKQVEVMREFLKQLEESDAFQGIEIVDHLQPFYMYDSINKQDLVESFRLVGKEALIVRRMGFIELLRDICNKYVRLHEIFMERNTASSDQWNTALIEFHQMVRQMSSKPIEELKDIPEIVEINRVYANAVKTPKPEDMMTNLVVPLRKYLSDLYRKNPSNIYAGNFTPILSKMEIAHHQNGGFKAGFANGLRYQIEILEAGFEKAKG